MTRILDRSRAPEPGPVLPLVLPPVERRTLSNGMELIHAEHRRLPLLSASLVFFAGASLDPLRREGVAELTAQCMEEGAGDRTSAQIADAIESLGARVSSWAGWDARGVSVNALVPVAPRALAVAADILACPTFPAHEVDRLRTERLADIQHDRAEPGTCAAEGYVRAVAAGHRFAFPQGGTTESVRSLTRDDLVAEHRGRYARGRACVVSVGAVGIDEVAPWIEEAFAPQDGTGDAPPPPPAPPATPPTRLVFLERPGSVQSELRMGHTAPPRGTPDYFSLLVMNTVLGGCFNSRLMLNLRERNRYTYGAHSRLDLRRTGGFFTASAAVHSEVTVPAIREMRSEITRLVEDGVTDAELQYARDYVAGVFPQSFETTGDIAHQLLAAKIHSLPADYLSTYQARVRAVSAEDVVRAARTYLHPDRLTIFVLGDRAALGSDLPAELPFETMTLDGDQISAPA